MKTALYITAIFGYLAGLAGAFGFSFTAVECAGFDQNPFGLLNMLDHPLACFTSGVRIGMGIMLLASLLVLIAFIVRTRETMSSLGESLIEAYPLSAIEIAIAVFALACLIQPAIFGITFLIVGIIICLVVFVWVAGHMG